MSQNHIIQGQVNNEQEFNSSLPNAHIWIENTTIGCVSNTAGQFQLHLPNSCLDSVLIVSYVGYEVYRQKVNKLLRDNVVIGLKEIKNELEEVKITPPDPVDILTKVIHKLEENYWDKPIRSEAFYREILFLNDQASRLSEAACSFYIEPFRHEFELNDFYKDFHQPSSYEGLDISLFIGGKPSICPPTNQLVINQARSSYDLDYSGLNFCLSGGPMSCLSFDILNVGYKYALRKHREYSETYKELKSRGYSSCKVRYSIWDDKPIYILESENSTYYIDKASYAIIQYNLTIQLNNTQKIAKINGRVKKYKNKKDQFREDSICISVKYLPINDKWIYLSTISTEYFTYLPYKAKETKVRASRELMFNKTTLENAVPLNNSECFPYRYENGLHHYPTNYNQTFWQDYNILYPTPLQKEIEESLESSVSLDEQFGSHFRYDSNLTAPIAIKKPDSLIILNTSFYDPYLWMNNESADTLMEYIKQENSYSENYFGQHANVIREYSASLNHDYSTKFYKGCNSITDTINNVFYDSKISRNGAIIYQDSSGLKDTLLMIDSKLKDYPDFELMSFGTNPARTIFYYCEFPYGDINSNDFRMLFINMNSKNIIDTIKTWNCYWLSDSKFLYTRNNDDEYFDRFLYSHEFGKDSSSLLFQVPPGLKIDMSESKSKDYYFVYSYDGEHDRSIHYIDKNSNRITIKPLIQAKQNCNYIVDHFSNIDEVLVSTNEDAPNWQLFKVDIKNTQRNNWEVILDEDSLIERQLLGIYDSLFIFSELGNLSKNISFYNCVDKSLFYFDTLEVQSSSDWIFTDKQQNIIIKQSTYLAPSKYYSFNPKSKISSFLGQDSIPNYFENNYSFRVERAIAEDGVEIPIVLLFKNEVKDGQTSPLYIETYGGGNIYYLPELSEKHITLMDKGFVVAFALVRGSGELGTRWRESARRINCSLSGVDFATAVKHLIEKQITEPQKIFAYGASYGGFVMGYVANNYPELFNGIIINVPYYDLLTNLSDTSIAESKYLHNTFGSPTIKSEFENLIQTCPYYNISRQDYPNILFLSSWQDLNVNPIDAIKGTAKLRSLNTNDSEVLLKVLLNSGHNPKIGKQLTLEAWKYAFMMSCLDKNAK